MTKILKRRYNWKPDIPDQRDFVYSSVKGVKLPKYVDLRSKCSPVEDQGNLGSCTANSLVGALEYLEIIGNKSFINLSRLFVYYNERLMEGTVNSDSGAMIRDGIKTLAKQGVCKETTVPYKISKFKVKPSDVAYKEALSYTISKYQRLSTLTDMKQSLANGYPFVFGFSVYDSFESDEVAKTGIVPMPSKGESCLGGHAVCAVGYDDSKKWFIVRNSWGPTWGDKGYFYMPYEYLTNRNLSDDIWTINK